MGERSPAGDGSFDVNSFDEWLEELARQKDVQKQDILNQMVSSYWILDDLMGLASETSARAGRDQPEETDDPQPADLDQDEQDPVLFDDHDDEADAVMFGEAEAPDGAAAGSDADDSESPDEIDTEAVAAILETLRENTAHRNPAGEQSDVAVDPNVDSLRTRLDDIETRLESQQSQFEDFSTQLRTQDSELGTLFEWLENHDEALDEIRSRLQSDMETLEASLDELEPRENADTERISDIESKVEEIESDLTEVTERREEAIHDIESQLRSDIETLEERLEATDPETETAPALEADIERLEAKLDAVEENRADALGRLESDFAADMEALSHKLAELEPKVENIEALETAIETVESSLNDLEARTEQAATQSDLADVSQRVVGLEEETTNRFESLQTNLQAEFDQLKTILDELFDTQQRIDSEMESLQSSYEDEIPPLTQIEEDYNAVAEIQEAANSEGISVAKCEGCDASVDIGLLSRPRCPNCKATVTDVSPKKGWFGGSDTLVTESTKPPVPDDTDVS